MDPNNNQKAADALAQILAAAENLKTAGFVLKFEVAHGLSSLAQPNAIGLPAPTNARPPRVSAIDQFIDEHADLLTNDDLEFLQLGPQVGTEDVRIYLGTSPRAAQKLLSCGTLKPGIDHKPKGINKYDTISVVQYVLRGKQPASHA